MSQITGRQKHQQQYQQQNKNHKNNDKQQEQQQQSDINKYAKRHLAAFDFDYTVVAQNTDTNCRDLLSTVTVAECMQNFVESHGWTSYMGEIFRLLHANKVTPQQILLGIRCIPEVPGFIRLLKRLHDKYDYDLIIISDSNTVFINEWLKSHDLQHIIMKVFTNPAYFTDDGLLIIEPYHHQTTCKMSAVNLCKGKILDDFIKERLHNDNVQYDQVIYVGDGTNDICPVTRLRRQDIACARQGFSMERKLNSKIPKYRIRCPLIIWKTGFDLLDQLETAFHKK